MENKIFNKSKYNLDTKPRKRRVGGNSNYDDNIDLIETMVSHSKYRDKNKSILLTYHYMSKIIFFMKKYEFFL